jgi:serine phosphatase RsbU (regulator of sigma subunit)
MSTSSGRSHLSLQWKFLLFIAGIVFVFGIVFFVFGFTTVRQTATQLVIKRDTALVGSYALSVAGKLRSGNELELDDVSALYAREEGVVAAYLLDDKGRYVSHSDFNKLGGQHPLYRIQSGTDDLDKYYRAVNERKQSVYIFTASVTEKLIANIEVSLSVINGTLYAFLFRFTAIFAVLLGLAVVAASLIARYLVRPIKALTRGAEVLASGNFNYQIENSRNDEIGLLTDQFNRMAKGILQAQRLKLSQERLRNELEIAKEIQMKLIPDKPLALTGYDVQHYYSPAKQIGGDYYDFFPLPGERLGIVLCDVSGKGIPAAIVMSMLKTIFLSLNNLVLPPREVLSIANTLLRKNIQQHVFATAFYGVLDRTVHTFEFAMAGAEKVILFDPASKKSEILKTAGLPLGIEEERKFKEDLESRTVSLGEGQCLFAYTDGLTDIRSRKDGAFFGINGIIDFLNGHEFGKPDFTAALLMRTLEFRGSKKQEDDLSFVMVHRRRGPQREEG